jgi:hypothetical protein
MERNTPVTLPERGSSTFLVLLATALIGHLSYRLIVHASAYSELVQTYQRGHSEQQSSRNQLQVPASNTRTCLVQSTTPSQAGSQRWSVCTLGSPSLMKNQAFPLPAGQINFNALFNNTPPCRWERRASEGTTFTTPRAAMTCIVPSEVDGNIRSLDNIKTLDLMLRPASPSETPSVTTPGTIEVESTLTLTSSTLIVAGGSVRIPRLATRGPEHISVTIISAHGDIIIGQVAGPASILGIGRQLLSVPTTPPSTSFLMPPFTTRSSIAGIIPVGYN